jgi:hypothetical protein
MERNYTNILVFAVYFYAVVSHTAFDEVPDVAPFGARLVA